MSKYISKVIVLCSLFYTLLIASTMTSAFSDGNPLNSSINKEARLKENNDTSESDAPNVIAKNIQTIGNILSSSPSDLAEQAKSYALGKFNSTVSSETQKWLSQFGTARINLGLDKKGTLENNSLDLLLPLYDNKADWLLFSQLGYRNKDSRNTINVGLGGRYFYQNWMYGLNTFYDHDLTGKNQRFGLGGEIWGDYIKLSANTYYRLNNWQNSRNFAGYYERPANGYDINGEFFLPAYPNLGAKLTYEQYFGDNVTLFNRDTKQKNPNLAKLGLTYTPVPLFTLGVDYKQGGSGHSETQFLANFNYKLGVPLSVQLSPENVAAARTLTGSRYDLVERNNHIVLEHQKKPIAQLSLPETIIGYSQEQHDITVNLSSNNSVKQIHWATNEYFEKHSGKLSSHVGNTIKITLPKYLSSDNQNNNYPIYAFAELENNQKSAPVEMRVIVRPFMLKKREGANFIPMGPLPATGDKEDGYIFNPVITFDTINGTPIKNTTINHVQWITDPKTGPESGLQFIDWEKSDSVAIDENGHFKHKPILISTQSHKDVKVYLKLDGQPPHLVGEVSFDEKPASFHVDKVKVSPQVPSLVADGTQTYTYTAVVLDSNNKPMKNQKITNVNWSKDKSEDGLIWNPKNGEVTTDGEGKLTATLASKVEIRDITVSLAIGNQKIVSAEQPVSFTADTKDYHISGDIQVNPPETLTADGQQKYTYTAIIVGSDGKPVKNKNMTNTKWKIDYPNNTDGLNLNQSDMTTDSDGKLKATLTSTKTLNGIIVSLTVGSHKSVQAKRAVDFNPEQMSAITVTPSSPILVNKSYTLTVSVKDSTGKNPELNKEVNWSIKDTSQKGLTLNPASSKVNASGEATTTLTSTQAQTVTVEASAEGVETPKSVDVEFRWPKIQKPTVAEKNGTVPADGDKNPQHAYHYTAYVFSANGTTPYKEQDIKFKWRLKSQAGGGDPKNTWLSESGEVTTKPDGTLTVQLLSSQKNPVVTGAIVCLAAVDEKSVEIPETEQCAEPVDFEAETLKIVSLDVVFDPNHPIKGGSNEHYTYTAKIVKADSPNTALPDGYKIDAKWVLDPAPEIYKGQDEWEIKSDNIVRNGQITATLSSQVGIGDINNSQVTDGLTVKLEVPAGRGKTTSSSANQQVAFVPPTWQAGLHVFSDKNKIGKIFKEQNRPYNAFQNLMGELVDLFTEKPIVQGKDKFSITKGNISMIGKLDPKGVIAFYNTGEVDLEMTITKSNKAKYKYKYNYNIRKFYYIDSNFLDPIKTDSSAGCTIGNVSENLLRIVNTDDLESTQNGNIPLKGEFPHSFLWGILDPNSYGISVIVPIYTNTQTKYLYDLKIDQPVSDNNTSGYLLCVQDSPP
ncbi:inverse autotransporter beta domain-containing protein [Xenorhabdus anantnagensis]|uniref:Inverse autotransporter beta domain-containing protein n=1 Tax=Xenorhabdus anantnagensis TaxID=3025875 RepID=A0ABT5LRI7_9GAMM|nr:inverse autotransporter beta domain-containing protein [Xenorhabdus anantnagensis]MDC9595699.1 inverse autotransporter beta domain-containing protein [Xenorhabdus anantnagensis]